MKKSEIVLFGLKTGDAKEKDIVKKLNEILTEYVSPRAKDYVNYTSYNLRKHKNHGGFLSLEPLVENYPYEYEYDDYNKYFGYGISLFSNSANNEMFYSDKEIKWILRIVKCDFFIKNSKVINKTNPEVDVLIKYITDNIEWEYIELSEQEYISEKAEEIKNSNI